MTSPITPDPSIHTRSPVTGGNASTNAVVTQLRQTIALLPAMIVKQVVDLILGYAGELPLVGAFFTNLRSIFDGVDLASPSFDLFSTALNFVTSFLDPTKLLFSNGTLGDANSFSIWPFNWGSQWASLTTNPIIQFIQNFTRYMPFLNLFNFDTNQAATDHLNDKLIPTGIVAPLVDGILQDIHAPAVVQNIIDVGVNAIDTGIQIGLQGFETGFGVFDLFNAFFGHKTATVSAQGSADFANSRNVIQDAQLAAQVVTNSGGTGVSLGESFDGTAAPALNANWSQLYSAGHAGSSGVDGSGNGVWVSGASSSTQDLCINRHITPLSTDTQSVFFTLTNGIHSDLLNNGVLYLCARTNSTNDTYLGARLDFDSAQIGYAIAGAQTAISADTPITHGTGDSWEFRVGVGGSSRRYQLLQNGVTIIDVTEVGTSSQLGASFRYTGFGMMPGITYFWLAFQTSPYAIQAWSAADR